ncbi:MAG: alpha/beta hydrolase [Desulfobacteraceae bacterium]|nr:alpha/beta hydrolase [Desulfobacteraceae bacterium]
MAILDSSKLRFDVGQILKNRQAEFFTGASEFISLEKNQGMDFMSIWNKVIQGNELFFKNKGLREELVTLLSYEEKLYLAGLFRYSFDHLATVRQKDNAILNNVALEKTIFAKINAEWQRPESGEKNRVCLFLHGGGWILGSSYDHRLLSVSIAKSAGIPVLSIDYRLAPEHPFPASLEDCITAYLKLLSMGYEPGNIVIAGDSAGGNLALATLIKLRDDKIPLPAAGIVMSPATDFTFSDSSFFTNGKTDPILADIGLFWWFTAYSAGVDHSDPLLSPLFANLEKLPPLLCQVSTCEMLYSDSIRFVEKARASGIKVELETWDDMPHVHQSVGLDVLPETKEAIQGIGRFLKTVF